MACRICRRTSCTESFHSLDEQETFDQIAGPFEDRIRELEAENARLRAELEKQSK